jgi:hypothetical protein
MQSDVPGPLWRHFAETFLLGLLEKERPMSPTRFFLSLPPILFCFSAACRYTRREEPIPCPYIIGIPPSATLKRVSLFATGDLET